HDGQHFDPIREDHIIDQVAKFPEPRRPHVLPHQTVHLRHRFEALYEPRTQAGSTLLEFVVGRLDVVVRCRPKDQGQTHDPFPNRDRASRHGLPTLGEASASARRLASSARCHSGTSSGFTFSGKLSQICSIRSSRSRTLSRSIPNASMVTGMALTPLETITASISGSADAGK